MVYTNDCSPSDLNWEEYKQANYEISVLTDRPSLGQFRHIRTLLPFSIIYERDSFRAFFFVMLFKVPFCFAGRKRGPFS